MISYKDMTFEQIDAMTIKERNQYIKAYGEILKERINQLQMSEQCTERTRALKYNQNALPHIITPTGEFKEFKNGKESSARLKNLIASLRSNHSTMAGQKVLSIERREKVKRYLKALNINRQFENKYLDFLDDILYAASDCPTKKEIKKHIESAIRGIDEGLVDLYFFNEEG